jgi:hypothetical protein
MTATRRDLFALGGLAALGSIGPVEAADLDVRSSSALRISVVFEHGKWQVAVPDFESMAYGDAHGWGWRPGMAMQYKWVPLEEYLAQVEEVCGLRPKAEG